MNPQDPVATNVEEDQETLQYITPFALNIHPSLLGLPLASPWKRGIAIIVDSAIIGMLSAVNGFLLVLALLFLFARLGSKKAIQDSIFSNHKEKYYQSERRILWGVGLAILLIVIVVGLFLNGVETKIEEDESARVNISDYLTTGKALELSLVLVKFDNKMNEFSCSERACWTNLMNQLVGELKALGLNKEVINEILLPYIKKTNLSEQDQSLLLQSLPLSENANKVEFSEIDKIEKIAKPEASNTLSSYSLVQWIKGILGDLGLSFGWATFYFTVFISYWHGQTPGKKLLRIQVIQINATPISLWDSFGRYGGYAAGISTGLLGFLQIFWDPNRQAIQDKISATFVIDLSRASPHIAPVE